MRRVTLLCIALLCLLSLQTALSDDIHLPEQSRIRHYVVPYDTQGQSIWGPGKALLIRTTPSICRRASNCRYSAKNSNPFSLATWLSARS